MSNEWKEHIKNYPKLEEYWNMIPEPGNILFSQQIDSFARSQAIEFAEWMYIYNTHYEYFKMYNGWKHKNTGHQDDVYIETSTFYSMFLAHQAKQKEGGKI